MTSRSLDGWLSYIESQHPSEIELGLDRGSKVLAKLNLSRPKVKVITVAGTNGKGSTCAMLTQYLVSQNYSVGTYTSPHFLTFNERIALDGSPCQNDLICQAFDVIETAREDIPLTYFEFSTLAALWIFDQAKLDFWVLEVGLGGRLDSVNMVDTDVAVVTSVSLDHVDWLGNNIAVIAQEKAGIARKGKFLISGVVNPPSSLAHVAREVGAILIQKGDDFVFQLNQGTWSWSGNGVSYNDLPIPSLPLENAATVVAVLSYMGLLPKQQDLVALFSTAQLVGRFQKVAADPDVYIDVAHNPEAAVELANRLASFPCAPIAVFGMLKDKDINSVVAHLAECFSDWFCADLSGVRGAKASELVSVITAVTAEVNTYAFDSVEIAFNAALLKAEQEQRAVVVFGSFVTVSEYLTLSQRKSDL
ncbi:bifunctional tetrahydrofolate synthase/dihydrofolate synthase [Marinomonas transparens]|uniref:Dihydrofolate synthase/folylpolyglutamate synthase n=1 Tax=Marinomonas transparens TaxID=2795388 RepID=A0A934N0Y8_9GAMM|nr:bifunctional tetrahydrofolate synthase/dihydrofolate synthase [Marinomonas transparens]MBJ7539020.1 bifunctional tetrahydrofolate synthase/dihydrofolate synthase [Marinomonas transparens]